MELDDGEVTFTGRLRFETQDCETDASSWQRILLRDAPEVKLNGPHCRSRQSHGQLNPQAPILLDWMRMCTFLPEDVHGPGGGGEMSTAGMTHLLSTDGARHRRRGDGSSVTGLFPQDVCDVGALTVIHLLSTRRHQPVLRRFRSRPNWGRKSPSR